jgi:uncharacterized membrane protein
MEALGKMPRGAPGPPPGRALWVVVLGGCAVQLALVLLTSASNDVATAERVFERLHHSPLHVYGLANGVYDWPSWPYPPGFFPLLYAAGAAAGRTAIAFDVFFRVPMVVAVGALGWAVAGYRRRLGASVREQLLAAALIVLGPSFLAWSAVWGQIDAVAILPAVLALLVWTGNASRGGRRALAAGLLIGLGAAIKTVPLLMVFALLPTARSRREATTLVVAAVAVPVVALIPFLVADAHGALEPLRYRGGPGLGGLSLVAQPALAEGALTLNPAHHLTALSRLLSDAGSLLTVAAVLVLAAVAHRRRVAPADAACLLWLGFYVFGVNWLGNYVLWGLPFFVLAGQLRGAALLQIALLGPTVLVIASYRGHYGGDVPAGLVAAYTVAMVAIWLGLAYALVGSLRNALGARPDSPRARPHLSGAV